MCEHVGSLTRFCNVAKFRAIFGYVARVKDPVDDVAVDWRYPDVIMDPGGGVSHIVPKERNVFAQVFEGSGVFERSLEVNMLSGDRDVRFLNQCAPRSKNKIMCREQAWERARMKA